MVSQNHTHTLSDVNEMIRSTLSRSEKLNYIEAVQCLGKMPARTPAAIAAGAKNRYDDFVVSHIILTQVTHGNVSIGRIFLSTKLI